MTTIPAAARLAEAFAGCRLTEAALRVIVDSAFNGGANVDIANVDIDKVFSEIERHCSLGLQFSRDSHTRTEDYPVIVGFLRQALLDILGEIERAERGEDGAGVECGVQWPEFAPPG